ncbi:MAG: hypothetical protein RL514_3487 [Verrucomicrobiota bacterium]|jgi:hypothetical protein
MVEQTVLFPGLPLPAVRGESVITNRHGRTVYKTKAKGYARPPGTGPAGEKCKTCDHCWRVEGGSKFFFKCDVIQFRWTHGPGTDIKANSPACELWAKAKTP